jgi:hypothetical protein
MQSRFLTALINYAAFRLLYSMYYNSFNDVLFLMKMEERTLRFRVNKNVLLIENLRIVLCLQRIFQAFNLVVVKAIR